MPNSLRQYPLFSFFSSKTECFPCGEGSTFLCMRLHHLGGLTPQFMGMDDRQGTRKVTSTLQNAVIENRYASIHSTSPLELV
jgi:hypothetical protein